MNLPELIAHATLDGCRCHPAVFAVEHIASGRHLIVATKNLSKRLHDQRRYLNRHQHHNAALQADLLTDGPEAFRFVLLHLVERESELKYLRRLHVERTRQQGKTYHADEQENRARLIIEARLEHQGDPTTGIPPQNPQVEQTLRRLREFADRTVRHPQLTAAWLDQLVD